MANTYSANTFTITESTNVAGLTALKGSAPAVTDNILVTGAATLTVEQSLTCRQLTAGFGAIDGASPSGLPSTILVPDNLTTITLADGQRLQIAEDCLLDIRGAMRPIGTGTGAAGQSYPLRHAESVSVAVDGRWWVWLPWLTGRRVTCGTTSASSTINVDFDPRRRGIRIGHVIDIRDHTTGALVGTRTVSALAATTITVTGGTITTSSAHAVYLPIAADEQVYTIVGSNAVFGDGVVSAWNVNGGAVPPVGATITMPGVVIRSSATTTGWRMWNFRGRMVASGCAFVNANTGGDNLWCYHDGVMNATDCAFEAPRLATGIDTRLGGRSHYTRCVVHNSAGPGFQFAGGGMDFSATDCLSYSNVGIGFSGLLNGTNIFLRGCRALHNAGATYAINSSFRGITIVDCEGIGPSGASFTNGGHSGRIVRGRHVGGLSFVSVTGNSYSYTRTAETGHAGQILQPMMDIPAGNDTTAVRLRRDSVVLVTPGVWYTAHPMHLPGLSAYGGTVNNWTLNGGTIQTQWRRSADYGHTWTDWADLPGTITATPDLYGECLQFRARRTDGGVEVNTPRWWFVVVNCTFHSTWTEPASWRGVHDVAATMRPQTIYQGGCVL